MKSFLFALSFLITTVSFAQAIKTETFKVDGNCAQCKKHIETAAKLPGVTSAVWNKSTKMFTVVYKPTKVSVDSIQSKIAAAGYDTPKFRANDVAYKALDECCQYDRTASITDKKDNR